MNPDASSRDTPDLPTPDRLSLTVVGCSGSTSGPDSAASGYLIRAWSGGSSAGSSAGSSGDRPFTLLLDCGPGVFGALYRYLDPAAIDAIGLSHLHPDHCLDLCAYYVGSRYAPTSPWEPVPLYAPAGALPRLARAYDPDPSGPGAAPIADLSDAFVPRVWQDDQQLGPFTVRTARVAHPAPCFAVRIEFGARSLVYSGDTGPSPALIELARDADLLLCEAAFLDDPDNPPGLHLSGRQAAEHAAAAGVGALVLTHIPPWHRPTEVLAEARPHFAGPIELATPGAEWALDAAGRR